MDKHVRTLGVLFIGFAVAQAAGLLWMSATRGAVPASGLFWAAMIALIAGYAWTGWQLWRKNPRARTLAIALSIFALLGFPVGTAIGAYGLFALWKTRTRHGGSRRSGRPLRERHA